MKINPKITFLVRKSAAGQIVTFDYKKEDGTVARRTLRPGIDVAAKFEREGAPLKKVGNWASGAKRKGKNNCIILRGGDAYISGTDMKDSRYKYFKLSRAENLK